MKIGFDVSQTGSSKAGCGFYAEGLIQALCTLAPAHEFLLYPAFGDLFWDPHCATATFRGAAPLCRPLAAPASFEDSQRFWRNPSADFEARLGHPDLIHSNNFFCPRGLTRARLVYTLHDLSFLVDPSWSTEPNRVGCWQGVFDAATRADWIAANSEFSRRHFLETFPHYPEELTSVVYPACRFRAGAPAPERPERFAHLDPGAFWLSVGSIEPRKNQRRVVEAHRISGSARPLVLAGGKGWLMEGFDAAAAAVQLPGYVTDEELEWLYRNAFAFLYPSLFEGFGMPALEAMTLGAPVIVSNTSSLPEVVGEAALQVDPLDAGAIAEAMRSLESDEALREKLRKAGRKRAEAFSWESSARKLLEIYDRVEVRTPSTSIRSSTQVHT